MRVMNKDTIALVDGCNLPYVIPMLCELENTIHEHSFDCGYETGYHTGYDKGWIDGYSKRIRYD